MACSNDTLLDTLEDNIGKVVTIFTTTGGAAGRGFTGLIVKVNREAVRLVSDLPEIPENPATHKFSDFDFDFDDRRRDRFDFNGGRCSRRCRYDRDCDCNGYGGNGYGYNGCGYNGCNINGFNHHHRHERGTELTIPIDSITCITSLEH